MSHSANDNIIAERDKNIDNFISYLYN